MNWTLYIVQNRLNQLYTGICTDLQRRFKEHCDNGAKCAKALKGKGPLELKFAAKVEDHSTALKAEIWVKKLTKAQKNKLIAGQISLEAEHIVLDHLRIASEADKQ